MRRNMTTEGQMWICCSEYNFRTPVSPPQDGMASYWLYCRVCPTLVPGIGEWICYSHPLQRMMWQEATSAPRETLSTDRKSARGGSNPICPVLCQYWRILLQSMCVAAFHPRLCASLTAQSKNTAMNRVGSKHPPRWTSSNIPETSSMLEHCVTRSGRTSKVSNRTRTFDWISKCRRKETVTRNGYQPQRWTDKPSIVLK